MFTVNTPNCGEILIKYHASVPRKEFKKITCSSDLNKYLRAKMFDPDMINFREEMALVLMDHSNKIIGWCRLSIGGISGTICDPRVIFFHALHVGASKIALAHNHPSGNLKPSNADIILTKKIREGAQIFEIMLLDHIIFTEDCYYSFADEGLI